MRALAVVTVVGVYGICTYTAPALTELVRENRVAIDAGSAPARTVDNHSVSLTPAGHGEAVGGAAARLDDVLTPGSALSRANRRGLRPDVNGESHFAGTLASHGPRASTETRPEPEQRGQDSPAPSTFIELESGETRRALAYTEWCALNTDDRAYITRWPQ